MSHWNYAHDFHRCERCDVTRSVRHLQLVKRVDEALRLDDQVFVCVDEARCAELKTMRLASLKEKS